MLQPTALRPCMQDLSGRPHLSFDLAIPSARIGTYDTQLVEHFFQSVVNTSGMTLHVRQLAGANSHHIVEATFKVCAKCMCLVHVPCACALCMCICACACACATMASCCLPVHG